MNRQQKEVVITELKEQMAKAQAILLINYQGMDVPALQSLRRNLRNEGSQLKVSKATLMRIAAKDIAGSDAFADNFKEQVGLVFVPKDVPGVAKQLVTFAKDNASLKIIAGFYESKMLSSQELAFLASLPSREVLIGQLLGTLQAPIVNLARLLHLLIARLAFVLKEIEKQQAEKR